MECCLEVGHFNLHYDFLVEDDGDLKDMLYKVDETLGDGIWEIYEVEVGCWISWGWVYESPSLIWKIVTVFWQQVVETLINLSCS